MEPRPSALSPRLVPIFPAAASAQRVRQPGCSQGELGAEWERPGAGGAGTERGGQEGAGQQSVRPETTVSDTHRALATSRVLPRTDEHEPAPPSELCSLGSRRPAGRWGGLRAGGRGLRRVGGACGQVGGACGQVGGACGQVRGGLRAGGGACGQVQGGLSTLLPQTWVHWMGSPERATVHARPGRGLTSHTRQPRPSQPP